MKLLFLLVILVGGAWFGPQLMEGASAPCPALEMRVATLLKQEAATLPPAITNDPRLAGFMGLLTGAAGMARGVVAEAYIRDQFPALPPGPGCVAAWWKLLVDPDLGQYLRGALPR